jgi:arsenate reductase
MKQRVLILCTGNPSRSQMAEGLLRHDAGDRFDVFSAGVRPNAFLPQMPAVMSELGIDMSHHRPKHVNEFAGQSFDYVLTVCDHARETCPVFSGSTRMIHHSFVDPGSFPEQERLARFREVRDQIREYLRAFPPEP